MNRLRGPYEDPAGGRPIKDPKINLHNLTGEMKNCINEAIWFCEVSDWECDCVDFLLRKLDEAKDLVRSRADSVPLETRELRECIGYLALAAKGLKGHNNSGRERLQADFTVVSAQRHKT